MLRGINFITNTKYTLIMQSLEYIMSEYLLCVYNNNVAKFLSLVKVFLVTHKA